MTAKRNSWSVSGELCCLCIVLAQFAFAAPVEAKGTFTILPAGTAAYSINDSGVVAGAEASGLSFVRTPDGTITTFKAADGAAITRALSINSSGVVTGDYLEAGVGHGFVRAVDGTITSFDVPDAGQQATEPVSINAQGVIAGYYVDQLGHPHGFVRTTDGAITTFEVPGAIATIAFGINDKGDIVGGWTDSLGHGFVRSAKGKITSFDVPEGALGTEGDAINKKGVITGYYLDQADRAHGYIRQPDGTFTTFDAAGTDTVPGAINAKGTVVGDYDVNVSQHVQGFSRSPSGKLKTIKQPNSNGGTFANSINIDGVVAGYFLTRPDRHTPYTSYGYIWTP